MVVLSNVQLHQAVSGHLEKAKQRRQGEHHDTTTWTGHTPPDVDLPNNKTIRKYSNVISPKYVIPHLTQKQSPHLYHHNKSCVGCHFQHTKHDFLRKSFLLLTSSSFCTYKHPILFTCTYVLLLTHASDHLHTNI